MTLITEWKSKTSEEVQELSQFLDSLHPSESLDNQAQTIAKDVEQSIDCLACGNCCRTSVTDFDSSDIKQASKALGISKKQFIRKYLIEDFDGKYITISTPCPFLNTDNTCKIYEARPKVCRSYPHTSRDKFAHRTNAHKANLTMCPITYAVVKRMKSNM